MSDKRAFEGVWIPAELWLSKDLSLQEKVMLVEINSLSVDPVRGCYKSNKAFAEFFNLSPSRVSEIISSLEKKGYLTITQKRDGKRICERNIFVSGGYSESRRGYSENTENPIRNPEGGYSENAEESSTGKSNTVRVIQGDARERAPVQPKKSRGLDFAGLPITEHSARCFADYRKKLRKPLTQRALELAAREIRQAGDSTGMTDEALVAEVELAGWQGVKADWLINRLTQRGGPRNGSSQPPNPFTDDIDWLDGTTGERVIQATGGDQAGLAGGLPGPVSHCGSQEPVADGADGGGYF
ncbi:helix-turn-helix domain-containing protein [Microbulbifer sp. 2201CG32-9]|uniref:helix-turn-helix domain-containing protein n=1 Tax=Microbulbifer sp. 2201CG32-9 TaxID=3232309 RepID=UPI00345C424E